MKRTRPRTITRPTLVTNDRARRVCALLAAGVALDDAARACQMTADEALYAVVQENGGRLIRAWRDARRMALVIRLENAAFEALETLQSVMRDASAPPAARAAAASAVLRSALALGDRLPEPRLSAWEFEHVEVTEGEIVTEAPPDAQAG